MIVPTRPLDEPPAAVPLVGTPVAVTVGDALAVSLAGGGLDGFELGFVVCLALVGATE